MVEKGGCSTRRAMNNQKIFQLAKGFRGRSKNCIRVARERVEKALQYAYRDRRTKKRDMRGLWIQRINAGTRQHGVGHLFRCLDCISMSHEEVHFVYAFCLCISAFNFVFCTSFRILEVRVGGSWCLVYDAFFSSIRILFLVTERIFSPQSISVLPLSPCIHMLLQG